LSLVLRMGSALTVVLVLLWAAARLLQRGPGKRDASDLLEVLARRPLGRTTSVAVVRVASQTFVLGITEQGISLLGEADLPPAAESPAKSGLRRVSVLPSGEPGEPGEGIEALPRAGRLAGSALSPATWRQAIELVRERTVRAG
jgi:flagellar protein FliO/FliZ